MALQPHALCLVSNIYQTIQLGTPLGGGKTVNVEVKPNSYLSNLDFALMGTFETRKGNWALAMDLVYNDFSGQKGKIKNVRGPEGEESLPIDVNGRGYQVVDLGGYRQLHRGTQSCWDAGRVRRRSLSEPEDLDRLEFLRAEGVIGRSGR